jgi:hypothetical protein
MAMALICDALATAAETEANRGSDEEHTDYLPDEFTEFVADEFSSPGQDIMETIPGTFAQYGLNLKDYAGDLVSEMGGLKNAFYRETGLTEEDYPNDETGDSPFVSLALQSVGHGVSMMDDPSLAETVKEKTGKEITREAMSKIAHSGGDVESAAYTAAQNALDALEKAWKDKRGDDEVEASLAVSAVTPPGFEKVVKKLKKDKGIDNPWAVAWSMKNKGAKVKGGGTQYRNVFFAQGDEAIEYLDLLDEKGVDSFVEYISDSLNDEGEISAKAPWGEGDRLEKTAGGRYVVSTHPGGLYIGVTEVIGGPDGDGGAKVKGGFEDHDPEEFPKIKFEVGDLVMLKGRPDTLYEIADVENENRWASLDPASPNGTRMRGIHIGADTLELEFLAHEGKEKEDILREAGIAKQEAGEYNQEVEKSWMNRAGLKKPAVKADAGKPEEGTEVWSKEKAEEVAGEMQVILQSLPYAVVSKSPLFGEGRATIMITTALDKKEDWPSHIFHNSRHSLFAFYQNGELDQFNKSFKIKEKFRKTYVKSPAEAAEKIKAYMEKVAVEPKEGGVSVSAEQGGATLRWYTEKNRDRYSGMGGFEFTANVEHNGRTESLPQELLEACGDAAREIKKPGLDETMGQFFALVESRSAGEKLASQIAEAINRSLANRSASYVIDLMED